MKNKLTILAIFMMLFSINTFAQEIYDDVVYLKNGDTKRGIIIEHVLNKSIKIQTKDKSVFEYRYDEILKLTKEINTDKKGSNYKSKGLFNITEVNYSAAIGTVLVGDNRRENANSLFGIKTINGYQFNSNISLGLGVGINKFNTSTMIPVFVDLRGYLMKGQYTPFVTMQAGYEIGINSQRGGYMMNPALGFKTYISKNNAFLFSFGYKFHQAYINYDVVYHENNKQIVDHLTANVFYSFITLNMGYSF